MSDVDEWLKYVKEKTEENKTSDDYATWKEKNKSSGGGIMWIVFLIGGAAAAGWYFFLR